MAAAAMGFNPPELPPEFRAPPPSPVAGGPGGGREPLGGGGDDNDELVGFIRRSVRIPELVLPDRILHRVAWKLPEIDLPLLNSEDGGSAAEALRSAATSSGCFQLMNHGIASDLITAAGDAAAAVFRMLPEEKRAASRSPERRWGFEIEEEEEEGEEREEFFWWSRRQDAEMAGNWATGFKDFFSAKMEQLWLEMDNTVSKVEHILLQNDEPDSESRETRRRGGDGNGSVMCLHKHGPRDASRGSGGGGGGGVGSRQAASLNHDVLRMLIRGTGCSHTLGLHICGSASRFNVYFKGGCMPFRLKEGGVVVTIGDQIQERWGGHYKHVIGKPEFHDGDAISISFFYSHSSCKDSFCITTKEDRTISLSQQVMIATSLVLFYQFILYLYANL